VRARLVGSAWGSDILVAPQRSSLVRWLTRQVLRACHITTSDSIAMADRMRELGAEEPMIVPFGLESLPPLPPPGCKDNRLFFANRGLEPIYAPHRVIDTFAAVASQWSDARLVVANDGSLRAAMESLVRERGLAHRVSFTGRLDAVTQAQWYEQARWYLSMPVSDALSVSVLEAMAYGCVPLLSDLPANRELVESGRNGLILPDVPGDIATRLERILPQADEIAQRNHAWVQDNGMFAPAVQRLLERMRAVGRGAPRGFKRFA
jgi:glycosyltransferase involved in cell wall biosynthesis